ncbi:MAG: hypothetical protein ABI432_03585 [Flavobacteriales bacterium]
MGFLRHHIVLHYLWLFLALLTLNSSVDTPDAQPEGQPEDLSINDIETVAEAILEHVFGIENAIPEHDEPDDHGGLLKKGVHHLYTPKPALAVIVDRAPAQVHISRFAEGWAGLYRPEPDAPPPKA